MSEVIANNTLNRAISAATSCYWLQATVGIEYQNLLADCHLANAIRTHLLYGMIHHGTIPIVDVCL